MNLPTTGGKKNFVDVISVLNNKTTAAKLQNFIDEVCRCKTKILDQNESIKGLREAAVDELGISPKMFNTLVSLHFNNDFAEKLEEIQQLEAAIEKMTNMTLGSDAND
jgi:hypothetical protein